MNVTPDDIPVWFAIPAAIILTLTVLVIEIRATHSG